MYGAIKAPKYMLAADVATSLTKSNDSYDSVRNALNVMADISNIENNSKSSISGGSRFASRKVCSSTPFVNSVYSALSASPFIGSIAREFTPILIGNGNLKHSALLKMMPHY